MSSKLNQDVFSEFITKSEGVYTIVDSSLSTIDKINKLEVSSYSEKREVLIVSKLGQVIFSLYDNLYIENNYLIGINKELKIPLLKI